MSNILRFASRVMLFLSAACLCASATTRVFSPAEYSEELQRLAGMAEQTASDPHAADAAVSELRGNWTVHADNGDIPFDTGWLSDNFRKAKSDEKARDELRARLQQLQKGADAFAQSPPDSTASRAKLNQILARSEFHQVHGPTWLDRLKFRILNWIFRILSRFFGSSSAPTAGRILVWTLVGVAVVVLAFFVYRTIRQNARQESFIPQVTPVSAKNWRVWMSEADAAARNGMWREAVHLAYWAGISFLEHAGMWRPDKARTPREYLRLLSAENQHRPALSALTRTVEVTWYGNDPAGPETFSEAVAKLEEMGCRQP